jgi:hypothetical protein
MLVVVGPSKNPMLNGAPMRQRHIPATIPQLLRPVDVMRSVEHVQEIERANHERGVSLAQRIASMLPDSLVAQAAGWQDRVKDVDREEAEAAVIIQAVRDVLEGSEDPYARGTCDRLVELLPQPVEARQNSDLIVANLPVPSPAETDMRTTYYEQFPKAPREGSQLVHVFWVVSRDHRALSQPERRNVVYPAERAGLLTKAPKDDRGVRLNSKGETSRCGFILTDDGARYFKSCVEPKIPEGFESNEPPPRQRRHHAAEGDATSLTDIKSTATR